MSRLSPEERLWEVLVDEMIDEAASVSVAQAEADLAAAGFDVEAERARAEAFLVSLEGQSVWEASVEAVPQEAPASSTRVERKRRPVAVWAAAAAAAVVAGGAVAAVYAARQPEQGTPPPHPPPLASSVPVGPSPAELAAAADLRRRAVRACDEGRAEDCLALLDEARAKDPAGDAVADVARARDKAVRTLEAKPHTPK